MIRVAADQRFLADGVDLYHEKPVFLRKILKFWVTITGRGVAAGLAHCGQAKRNAAPGEEASEPKQQEGYL
jgi:hypothetical protein